MSAPEHTTQKVSTQQRWPHEALDFTPWLADNLHLLGKVLDLDLKLDQTEFQVGPFALDILAKEGKSGVKVAIENQYDWTDHSHLGQALTYAAGVDARIVIWVVPEFRNEHSKALHWLNNWTKDEIGFYGVEVSLTKTEDSFDEPSFRKVVWPGGWIKRDDQQTISPRAQQFQAFFQPLIVDLGRTGFAYSARQIFDSTGRGYPAGLHDGILYAASLEGTNDAWITLHISMKNNQLTKQIFDTLEEDRTQIESSLDADWHWYRHSGSSFSSINVRSDGSIDDSPENLEEIRAWMLDMLPKLKGVFNPRLERILSELPAEDIG
jgi:hypothetical protein